MQDGVKQLASWGVAEELERPLASFHLRALVSWASDGPSTWAEEGAFWILTPCLFSCVFGLWSLPCCVTLVDECHLG